MEIQMPKVTNLPMVKETGKLMRLVKVRPTDLRMGKSMSTVRGLLMAKAMD
jgi:hypothetical protein